MAGRELLPSSSSAHSSSSLGSKTVQFRCRLFSVRKYNVDVRSHDNDCRVSSLHSAEVSDKDDPLTVSALENSPFQSELNLDHTSSASCTNVESPDCDVTTLIWSDDEDSVENGNAKSSDLNVNSQQLQLLQQQQPPQLQDDDSNLQTSRNNAKQLSSPGLLQPPSATFVRKSLKSSLSVPSSYPLSSTSFSFNEQSLSLQSSSLYGRPRISSSDGRLMSNGSLLRTVEVGKLTSSPTTGSVWRRRASSSLSRLNRLNRPDVIKSLACFTDCFGGQKARRLDDVKDSHSCESLRPVLQVVDLTSASSNADTAEHDDMNDVTDDVDRVRVVVDQSRSPSLSSARCNGGLSAVSNFDGTNSSAISVFSIHDETIRRLYTCIVDTFYDEKTSVSAMLTLANGIFKNGDSSTEQQLEVERLSIVSPSFADSSSTHKFFQNASNDVECRRSPRRSLLRSPKPIRRVPDKITIHVEAAWSEDNSSEVNLDQIYHFEIVLPKSAIGSSSGCHKFLFSPQDNRLLKRSVKVFELDGSSIHGDFLSFRHDKSPSRRLEKSHSTVKADTHRFKKLLKLADKSGIHLPIKDISFGSECQTVARGLEKSGLEYFLFQNLKMCRRHHFKEYDDTHNFACYYYLLKQVQNYLQQQHDDDDDIEKTPCSLQDDVSVTQKLLKHFAIFCWLGRYAISVAELLLRLEDSTETLGNDSNALAAIDGGQYASIVTLIEAVVNLVPPPSDEPRDKEHQSDIAATIGLFPILVRSIKLLSARIVKAEFPLFPLDSVDCSARTIGSGEFALLVKLCELLTTACADVKERQALFKAVGNAFRTRIMAGVTNWTESRLKEIVGKSKYTVETVIDDMNEFTNLMQEATHAIASSPTVACAFNSFGVDYYKFISVMIDRQMSNPLEELSMRVDQFYKCYKQHSQNVFECSRSFCKFRSAVRLLLQHIFHNIGASENMKKKAFLKLRKYEHWSDEDVAFFVCAFRDRLMLSAKTCIEIDRSTAYLILGIYVTWLTEFFFNVQPQRLSALPDFLGITEYVVKEWHKIFEDVMEARVVVFGTSKLIDMICDAFVLYTELVVQIVEENVGAAKRDESNVHPATDALCKIMKHIEQLQTHLDKYLARVVSVVNDHLARLELINEGGKRDVSEQLNNAIQAIKEDDEADSPVLVDFDRVSMLDLTALLHGLVDSAKDDIARRVVGLKTFSVALVSTQINDIARSTADGALEDNAYMNLQYYLSANLDLLVENGDEETYYMFRDGLWSSVMDVYCGLAKDQLPNYVKLMQQLKGLYVSMQDKNYQQQLSHDIYRRYCSLLDYLIPSEEKVLDYYNTLCPSGLRSTSLMWYGKILVKTMLRESRDKTLKLLINVVEAKNLSMANIKNNSNTYVRVELCPSTSFAKVPCRIQKSKTVLNDGNPEFKCEFIFHNVCKENLKQGVVALISAWHTDTMLLPDVFIGEAVLPLHKVYHTSSPTVCDPYSYWLTLKRPAENEPLFNTMVERSRYDPVAMKLVQERCQAVDWSDAEILPQGRCSTGCNAVKLVGAVYSEALSRLVGRQDVMPAHADSFTESHKPAYFTFDETPKSGSNDAKPRHLRGNLSKAVSQ